MSKYLTRKQVAEKYPISFSHLAHLASQGRGIRYRIIGKCAVYSIADIEAWLEAQVIEPGTIPLSRKRGRPRKTLSVKIIGEVNDNDEK